MYLQRIIAILTALVMGTHQLFVSAIVQPTPYSIKESESQLYYPNIKEESLEETVEDLSTQEKPWMSVTEMFQFANANRDIASKYKQLVGLRNDIEEVYIYATSVAKMHKHYEPIQEKQALVYSYLEEADRLLLCFIKENITSEFDTGDELTNTAVDYEKELKTLITKASLVNLSVDCFYGFHDLSQSRKNLVLTAMSLEGKITYEWGAKAKNAGWNTRWDTKGNGLDCSGFIEWVYWTVTGSPNEQLRSTLMITYSQEEITHNELQPGDLGTKLDGGTYYLDYQGNKYYSKGKALKANEKAGYTEEDITTVYNHVGIYVGKDIYGNDLWCHCAGGEIRTVTIGTFEEFTHYYRMPGF